MKIIFAILLFCCTQSFALKEYYSITKSVRSLGMGGANYARSDDEYALFYNPAGLSFYDRDWQLMLNINSSLSSNATSVYNTLSNSQAFSGSTNLSDIVDKISEFQGQPIYGGVGLLPFYVRRRFGVGLLLADTKANIALLGAGLNSSLDMTAILDNGIVMAYGRPIYKDVLHIGLATKILLRAGGKKTFSVLDIAKTTNFTVNPTDLGGAGIGFDLDLGAMWDLPNPPLGLTSRFGLVLSNLLASKFTINRIGGAPPGLVRTLSLGNYTVFPGVLFIDNFHVAIDFAEFSLGGETDPDYGARTGSFFKHVNVGVEMPIHRWLSLRTGFRQGLLTAGIGMHWKYARLDFTTYAEELASGVDRLNSRRFALTLAFGGGEFAPAPITGRAAPVQEALPVPPQTAPKEQPVPIQKPVHPEGPATEAPKKTN
ncbi:MAG: hypothetical protein HY537_08880 [Deltaproteobacteria bacterium]|nr:hypothetical protein [Deltaproteobacteria bacterium]